MINLHHATIPIDKLTMTMDEMDFIFFHLPRKTILSIGPTACNTFWHVAITATGQQTIIVNRKTNNVAVHFVQANNFQFTFHIRFRFNQKLLLRCIHADTPLFALHRHTPKYIRFAQFASISLFSIYLWKIISLSIDRWGLPFKN